MKRVLVVAALAVGLAMPAWGQDFDAGVAAYDRSDYAAALREWQPLADLGNAEAQHRLGGIYRYGEGVQRDYVEAAKWHRLAAEQGHTESQLALGKMHFRCGSLESRFDSLCPSAVPVYPDYSQAVRWYRMAAEQANAEGQLNLGQVYLLGTGVPKDFVLAYKWLNLAAAQSSEYSSQRDQLEARMTPEQIAEAQRLVREWQPTAE